MYAKVLTVVQPRQRNFRLLQMTFVQATTGGGGWPMSVWLTPDLKPFYGGTYYPGVGHLSQVAAVEGLACTAVRWRASLGAGKSS